MRKILILILSSLFILTGCSWTNDTEYINIVKQMTFNDGETVNDYVNNIARYTAIYSLNNDKIMFTKNTAAIIGWGLLNSKQNQKEMYKTFKQAGLIVPEKAETKWLIEGKTKTGKIILVTTENAIIKINTKKNGDYIEFSRDDIKAYDPKTKKILTKTQLSIASGLNSLMESFEKNNDPNKMKEFFDPQAYIKSAKGEGVEKVYTLFSSGRVKSIWCYDGDEEYEDQSLVPIIKEQIKDFKEGVDEYCSGNSDGYHLNGYSDSIKVKIVASKLNKNITDEEKEQINELEKEVYPYYEKFWEQNKNQN